MLKLLLKFSFILSLEMCKKFTMMFRLAKEEELIAARTKAEELEKENCDISSKLAQKEQELDQRTQEKVIIILTFITMFYLQKINLS